MQSPAAGASDLVGNESQAVVHAVFDTHVPAPSEHQCDHLNCYWSIPMDITDEDAVWAGLMAPVTIVSGGEKEHVVLYSEPNETSDATADITCASQAVHVLDTLDNGWSLVEAYSSSFSGSKVEAWNTFTQGYIKTGLLKEKSPGNKEFGLEAE